MTTHPRYWTIPEMAAHLGVRETAILKRILVARRRSEAEGAWPADVIPRPEPGGWVKWDSTRPDVRAWVRRARVVRAERERAAFRRVSSFQRVAP